MVVISSYTPVVKYNIHPVSTEIAHLKKLTRRLRYCDIGTNTPVYALQCIIHALPSEHDQVLSFTSDPSTCIHIDICLYIIIIMLMDLKGRIQSKIGRRYGYVNGM